jgi:LPPG:FO 2-phospho-L-lactate transferase
MDHVEPSPGVPTTEFAVTVLCGGFGAARFVTGIQALARTSLTCVVNTADDFEHLGLRISPDLDSVLYALAGVFDEDRGWGPVDDALACNDALRRYGDEWFSIGDRDFALHLKRTQWMREGSTLAQVTGRLVRAWGLSATILPMSDDPVRTAVRSGMEWLAFQDYMVRRRGGPTVDEVRYDGAANARPALGVITAITTADLVVVAPSNPVSSIGAILAVPGVRQALRERTGPTVAVTPVVSGIAPARLPEAGRARVRAALMAAMGLPHRADAVARLYAGFIDGFVLDERDAAERGEIESLGVDVLTADTLAPPTDRAALAGRVVQFGLGCARRAVAPVIRRPSAG